MTEVITTDEFRDWYQTLARSDAGAVYRVVSVLEEKGPTLPFPYSSAIANSRHAFRELRVQSGGHPLRVFYVFD